MYVFHTHAHIYVYKQKTKKCFFGLLLLKSQRPSNAVPHLFCHAALWFVTDRRGWFFFMLCFKKTPLERVCVQTSASTHRLCLQKQHRRRRRRFHRGVKSPFHNVTIRAATSVVTQLARLLTQHGYGFCRNLRVLLAFYPEISVVGGGGGGQWSSWTVSSLLLHKQMRLNADISVPSERWLL